ncbi:MAG: hypothetical protein HY854_11235 [Burkholderiales bacterium]|nr:hypothetical protein [Burkholderiales bacterium]
MATPTRAPSFARASAWFVLLGLLLYAVLFAAAERLAWRNGHANPFFRIESNPYEVHDWVILGASHAMPLDFGGFGTVMERATGRRIINLAAQGTGPLYQRAVLERYLARHHTANVMVVVDSFACQSRAWNEDRFADPKLLAHTPWRLELASQFARYVVEEGIDWRAWLNYATGFAKVNDSGRFEVDMWEGEGQFDRTWRVSQSAVRKRIAYLYPAGGQGAGRARYFAQLAGIAALARRSGAKVVFVKLPMPSAFAAELPGEDEFDEAVGRLAGSIGVEWHNLGRALPDARFYFDSDHLNRAGVAAVFDAHLKALLVRPNPA